MSDLATTTFEGNLTRDPELAFSRSGKPVANFSVAVNRSRRVGDGWESEGHFFDCVAFGELAENLAESVHKGDRVVVAGRPNHNRWETEDGEKRSRVVFVVDAVGASLRFATAVMTKTTRNRDDVSDLVDDEGPF